MSARPFPAVAYLRTYEPLVAFGPEVGQAWARYAASDEVPDLAEGAQAERLAGLDGLVALPRVPYAGHPEPPGDLGQAFVHVLDGVTYVCPWDSRLRALQALATFRAGLPAEIADAFVPGRVAEAADAELANLLAGRSHEAPHVLTSTWQVPVRWFVPFDAAERQSDPKSTVLRYRTTMAQARRRTARALATLRRAGAQGSLLSDIEEIGRWLEEFHPRSLVELDYGGLASIMGSAAVAADTSVADVAAGLAGLAGGREDEAFAAYRRVVLRWEPLRALEHAT